MYKAKDNIGIYRELQQLIYYVEAEHEEELLNTLMVKFRKEGLSQEEIREAVILINRFLPSYIECDKQGCYLINEINGEEVYTYIPEETIDKIAIDLVNKKYLVEV